MKIIRRTALALGAMVVLCAVLIVLFPGPIVNSTVKPAFVRAFTEAFPQYVLHLGTMHVALLTNQIECDSFAVEARADAWSARGAHFSVSGIDWWSMAWRGQFASDDGKATVIAMCAGAITLPGSAYELRYDSLRVSMADSGIVMTSVTLLPLTDDEMLFGSSPYRKTRLRMAVPRFEASGVACLDLLQGKTYRARSVRLLDAAFDILINKEKPSRKDSVHPMMPGELFASIGVPVRVDSLTLSNATLNYGERLTAGGRPGVITLDSMQTAVACAGITAARCDTILVKASGRFMNAGKMSVVMVIPVGLPGLSYRYSGSLSGMHLASLNTFLEHTEHMRITQGVLQEATFAITVASGRATGSVRALYRGLVVAVIDKRTGSAAGVMDGLVSFITNRFKIRGTNMPDASGKTHPGVVRYTHKIDEAFMEFTWFALRSGVGDVVGF